jgi:hypothetical protein
MAIRGFFFRCAAVLIGIVISLVGGEIALRFFPVSEGTHQQPVNQDDPILRFERNRSFILSKGWNFSIVAHKHANNEGFFNDFDYAKSTDQQMPLLAIIGDSYVEAGQMANRETVNGLLAQTLAQDDKGRAYSFGASGAALSMYLAYAQYAVKQFGAGSLVFVVVGNDFDESLIEYKNAPGFHYFSLRHPGELIRVDYEPGLLKKLARRSALIRYIVLDLGFDVNNFKSRILSSDKPAEVVGHTLADASEARVGDSKWAVDEFFRQLPTASKLTPDKIVFVVDGPRPTLYSEDELARTKDAYSNVMRKYFMATARKNGYEVIDMMPIFVQRHQRTGERFEFPTDGHWNQTGHAAVADAVRSSRTFRSFFAYE